MELSSDSGNSALPEVDQHDGENERNKSYSLPNGQKSIRIPIRLVQCLSAVECSQLTMKLNGKVSFEKLRQNGWALLQHSGIDLIEELPQSNQMQTLQTNQHFMFNFQFKSV